jgi:hypothetical protein
MLTWFNALVSGSVLIILIIAGGEAVMRDGDFSPVTLAASVFMLLMLPVLYKLAGRRPREKRRK